MTKVFGRKDLRVVKTRKALKDAMAALLSRGAFKSVTVNDLCAEALMSRAAFYAHFYDKYDLLEYYLKTVAGECFSAQKDAAECIVGLVTGVQGERIRNILICADAETRDIVNNFIASIVDAASEGGSSAGASQALLTDFWVGGIIHFIMRQTAANLSPAGKADFIKLMGYYAELRSAI